MYVKSTDQVLKMCCKKYLGKSLKNHGCSNQTPNSGCPELFSGCPDSIFVKPCHKALPQVAMKWDVFLRF